MLTYSVVRRTVVGPWGWAREGNEKDMLGLGEAKQGSENWGRSAGAIINLRASLMVQMVKNLPAVQEWKWKCWSLSRVWLFATSWTVAHQAPLSMKSSRQEYWSGLPFPSPGDRPRSGIKPMSPTLAGEGNGSSLQYCCLGNPTEKSLVGYSSWDHKALDTTGRLNSFGRQVLYHWATREAPYPHPC